MGYESGNTQEGGGEMGQPDVPSLSSRVVASDRIELQELLAILGKGKWLILVITAFFSTAAVAFALLQPNVYRSEAVLAPAVDTQRQGLAGLSGQLGGLASLAGIDLGTTAIDKSELALEVLRSRAFIADFVSRRGILVYVIAGKSWSIESNQWEIDPKIYDVSTKKWTRVVDPPQTPQPSEFETAKAFNENVLEIKKDDKTGMVRVSVSTFSPMAARQWLDWLITDLNQWMRTTDIQDAQKSIDFLSQQIEKTSVAEMRQVFYGLIEQQTKTMMLAQVRDEYVFKTVDPPVVPDRKAKPMRALISGLGMVVGAMLGTLFVLLRHFASPRRNK